MTTREYRSLDVKGSFQVEGGAFQVDSSGRISVGGGSLVTDRLINDQAAHPGTATQLYGAVLGPTNPSTTTAGYTGFWAQTVTAAAAFTLAAGYSFYGSAPSVGASSAITTQAAFVAANQGAAGVTNAFGFWAQAQSGAATLNIAARLSGGTQANLWLDSDTASAAGGIAAGTARDTTLFRSASGIWTASGLVVSGGAFLVDSAGRMALSTSIVSNAMLMILAGTAHPSATTTASGIVVQPVYGSTVTSSGTVYYGQAYTAAAAFTLVNSYVFFAASPSPGAGSAITNQYGAKVLTQGIAGVTNAFGIDVDAQSGAATLNIAARLSGGTQANLWLNSDTASAAGGIALGTARDTTIFRASAGVVQVQGLTATSTLTGLQVNAGTDGVGSVGLVRSGSGSSSGGGDRFEMAVPGDWSWIIKTAVTVSNGDTFQIWGGNAKRFELRSNGYTGFFGVSAVAQPTGSSDVLAGLVSVGLRAASSNPPLNLGTGDITAGTISLSSKIITDTAGRIATLGNAISTDSLIYLGSDATHPYAGTSLYGIYESYLAPATATVAVHGITTKVRTVASAFTVTTGYGFRALTPNLGASSAITTLFGVAIENQGTAGITNAYGLLVNVQSGAATLNVGVRIDAATQAALWLNSDTATAAGGIALGTARDTTIVRSSAGVVGLQAANINGTVFGVGGTNVRPAAAGNLATYLMPNGANSVFFDLFGTDYQADATNYEVMQFAIGTSEYQINTLASGTGTRRGLRFDTLRLGFFGATPAVVPTGSTDVLAGLVTLGLRAASSNPPLNLGTGAITAGNVIGSAQASFGTVSWQTSTIVSVSNQSAHPGSAASLFGVRVDPTFPATTTSEATGIFINMRTAASAFTMANAEGLWVGTPTIGAGSAITSLFGAYIDNQGASGVANAVGILIAAQSGAATTNVGLKINTATTAALWFNSNTASAAGGITFGTARDVNLYRNASTQLETAAFNATTTLTLGGVAVTTTATAVLKADYTAKGVVLGGTGVGTYASVGAIGANNTVLMADSSTATGMKWGTVAVIETVSNPVALGTAAPGAGTTAAAYNHVHPTTGLGVLASANSWGALQTITSGGVDITGGAFTASAGNFQVRSSGTVGIGASASNTYMVNAQATHPGTVATLYGFATNYTIPSNAPTTTHYSFFASANTAAVAFTLTSNYGFYADVASLGAGSSITNNIGLASANRGAAGVTTAIGLDVAAQSGATNNYAARLSGGTQVNLYLNSDTASAAGGINFGTTIAANQSMYRQASGVIEAGGTLSAVSGFQVNHAAPTAGHYLRGNGTAFVDGTIAMSDLGSSPSSTTFLRGDGTWVAQISGSTDVLAGLVTQGLRAASSNPPLNLGSGALTAGAITGTSLGLGTGAATMTQLYVAGALVVDSTAHIINGVPGGGITQHPSSAASIYGIGMGFQSPTTATTRSIGFYGFARVSDAMTQATAEVFLASTPNLATSGNITTLIGFHANNQGATRVTNAFGIDVDAQSGAATLNIAARLSGGTQANLWLNSDTATEAGGIVFGTARDTSLSRNSAGVLQVGGQAGAGSLVIVTDAGLADGQSPHHRAGAANGIEWSDAVHANSHFFIIKNPGAATVTAVGTAAPTLTATASNLDGADGAWLNSSTTATSGNASGIVSAFTLVQTGWLPEMAVRIKTPANIAAIRLWIGLFSGSPDASATPAVHLAAFRYDTGADGTAFWRLVTDNGSGAPNVVTSTIAIATSTVYLLRIAFRQSDGMCLFYINGVLAGASNTKLPTTTQLLGYGVRVTTLTTAAKAINTGRISMSYV